MLGQSCTCSHPIHCVTPQYFAKVNGTPCTICNLAAKKAVFTNLARKDVFMDVIEDDGKVVNSSWLDALLEVVAEGCCWYPLDDCP